MKYLGKLYSRSLFFTARAVGGSRPWTSLLYLVLFAAGPTWAGEPSTASISGPWFGLSSLPTVSPAVRDLPDARLKRTGRKLPPRRNPRPDLTGFIPTPGHKVDPLLSRSLSRGVQAPPPLLSVDGMSNQTGVTPPDPIGAVGPRHYVQMVNDTFFAVYDKQGNVVKGATAFKSLWSDGPCAGCDDGDPVVVFDALASRWVLSQFRSSSPFGLCLAVSRTDDPTGAFNLYEFTFPENPDYFKLGVWPDAYYIGTNETTYTVYALDRAKMLAGQPAGFIRFTGETNFMMPASHDGGPPPPADAPGIFYTFKNKGFSAHNVDSSRLEIRSLQVDWNNPETAVFSSAQIIPLAEFNFTVCGFFENVCIPQTAPGWKVDAVSEWPMWRLVYRRFPAHETLVGNFTINVADLVNPQAGIRWFELRRTNVDWSLHQEGTLAPDGLHRWMGSLSLDQAGNIALAYSVSGPDMAPDLRYTTRVPSDPPGAMGPETVLVTGGGVQEGSNRWGDYSALTVDPVDQCTFWFTGEYYSGNDYSNWNTRIGAFKVPDCLGQVNLFLPLIFKPHSLTEGKSSAIN